MSGCGGHVHGEAEPDEPDELPGIPGLLQRAAAKWASGDRTESIMYGSGPDPTRSEPAWNY